MKKFTHIIFTLIVSLLGSTTSFAGNYTWTGTTNTDWATGTSWNPNGVPSTNDTVTIVTNTNLPVLAANTTIKKFTMTSGTLDCNGYTLTISATATFNGGTINNGTLTCSGTSTLTFAGTTFGVVVNATGNNLLFNGSVFNNSLTAVKKGSSNDNSIGNNIFNGVVTLTDSGSGSLVLSNTTSAPDTFNSTLTVSATSTGSVYLAHQGTGNVFNGDVTFSTGNVFSNTYGTSAYNGNITLNSASANISFGNSTGTWTLASGKNISIGTFSAGTLTIRNLTQSDNSINMRLALTGTGKLVLGNNSISAKLYASSNQLTFSATRFLSADTLIYTGGNNATSAGGNYFGSTVYIANTFSGNNYHFTIGSASVDTFTTTTTIATTGNTSLDVANGLFLGAVTFKNSITGTLSDRFYVWDCTFKGALTLDGIFSAIKFKNGTGNSLIDSTATLSLVSGYAGQLTLSYIEQRGNNAINLNMSTNTSSGNNTILTVGPNAIFNANFYYLGQRLELNGGVFNGNASFTRFSQQPDICVGGNVFNGNTLICDSVAATTANRVFKLANTTADDFNGNVTFKQYGTGSSASTMKMYPSYTANSTFAGNVTVESNNVPIEFGANGGRVILDGSINDTLKNTGSYNPTIKKLEIKKTGGVATLKIPLTITDSVIFTSGYLKTDSVNLLTVADNCIVTGASDYSAIVGPIKKVGNDEFTFPFGEVWTGPPPIFAVPDYVYHPLTISAPSSSTDAYTAQYFSANHNKGTNADSTIENESVCEYWKLTRTNGSSNVTVKLGWNWTSCNVYGLDSMHVAVWDTATSKWKDKGNGGTTGNLTSGGVVSSSAISTFGIMTLADKFCTTLKPIATATDVTCPGNQNGTARVAASGATPPYTYTWSPRTGVSVSLWDLNAGTYHVTVTDSRGCAITDSAIVSDPDSIHLTISTTPSDCHDSVGTAKVTATGGSSDQYNYFWTPGGETEDSLGGLPAGIYKIVVSDSKGCPVDTTITISDSDGPEVEIDSLVNVDCYGNNSGFAKIIFSDPIEHDPLWPCNIPNPDRIAAGTYPVMMEDNDGCFTIVDVTITEPSPITLVASTTQSDCGESSGTAAVLATGGTGMLIYKWSSGGVDSIETGISAGYDTVVVTDENGCSAQTVVFISDSDGPALNPSVTNASCFDSNTGSINIDVTSGTSPFSYLWYPTGETTAEIDSLYASTYSVLVTDSNGCKSREVVTVNMPEQLIVPIYYTAPTVDSLANGSAFAEVKGGTPPYSYLWNIGSQTTSLITGLDLDDEYTVTVTDNSGCSKYVGYNDRKTNRCDWQIWGGGYGCNSNAPSLLPSDFPGYCISVTPCNLQVCTLSIAAFGAIPDDLISDECAFESANDYINNLCANGITDFHLTFEAGQYDIGRQDDWGTLYAGLDCPDCGQGMCPGANNTSGNCCWYKKGHNIFNLNNLRNCSAKVSFEGAPLDNSGNPTTKFRFVDCMLYGAFDPLTGERYISCPGTGFDNCSYGAFPGIMFKISDCDNVTIKNLELDGNVQNFSIGGYFSAASDGIQLAFDGIVLHNSSSIFIESVNVHDFGQDGLLQAKDAIITNIDLHLTRSKFNNNRRDGFSWDSGQGVYALFCDFDFNGMGNFTSRPGVGMDLEWEGGSHVALGYFYGCRFRFNGTAGVICDAASWDGDAMRHHDFYFEKCTFVGSQSGLAVRPTGRGFNFTCCDFYGSCQYLYNAYNDWNIYPHPNKYNAKFKYCNFHEEYTDDNNSTFCLTPSGTSNPVACFSSTIGLHPYLCDFAFEPGNGGPSGRAEFDQCTFNTGYFNKWGTFMGNITFHFDQHSGLPVGWNDQRFINCNFNNTGLDGSLCFCGQQSERKLGDFNYTTFLGTNSFNYPPANFVRNWTGNCYWVRFVDVIPFYDIPIGCGPAIPPFQDPTISNISLSSTCYPKYANPTSYYWQLSSNNSCNNLPTDDPDVLSQYCINDAPTYIAVPDNCIEIGFGPEERRARENKNNMNVYPVPSNGEVWVQNGRIGDVLFLHDVLGNEIKRIIVTSKSQSFDISKYPPGIYYLTALNSGIVKIVKY